jgi:hypothetical protein
MMSSICIPPPPRDLRLLDGQSRPLPLSKRPAWRCPQAAVPAEAASFLGHPTTTVLDSADLMTSTYMVENAYKVDA